MYHDIKSSYQIGDSMRAVVIGNCSKGVYLDMEDGQEAFATFDPLPRGTRVFCTILKKQTERFRTFVAIDAVVGRGIMTA